MKKSKAFVAAVTATVLAVGGGALAGCKHSHEYSKDWTHDAEGHWHVAVCDDLKSGDKDYTKDYAAHVWGDDDTCDVCAYTRTPTPSVTEYTVTLNAGEGTLDGAATLTTVNGKLTALPVPTAPAGKTFVGWYTAATDGVKVTTDYKFSGTATAVTIYAVYEDEVVASKVTLSATELTLDISNTEHMLTATVAGGGTVVWSSDNPTVVAVNEETGYIEALKPGAATITATVAGGEDHASCEVLVEDAYYLIGGQDALWNKAGTFGQESVVYFMPTVTEGIYKTASTELPRLGNFQVALVGITTEDWWKSAYNGNYIAAGDAVLSKNSGNNIAVEKHGMYTITLDMTGDKPSISGVCDREIDDGEIEEVYYLIGAMNNWTLAGDKEAAGEYAFVQQGDGSYTITVKLTKGQEFKIAMAGMAWNVEFAESALPRTKIGTKGTATTETTYQLEWTSSSNIGVGVTGYYTFTLNPDAVKYNQLDYTFSLTAPGEVTPEPEPQPEPAPQPETPDVTVPENTETTEPEV